MNHLLAGMLPPFLAGLIIYIFRRGRAGMRLLAGVPLAMLLGGVWALVPDFPLLINLPEYYFRLHRDPRINVFFWHYSIDALEDAGWTFAPWDSVALACIWLAVTAAALRELRRREGGC